MLGPVLHHVICSRGPLVGYRCRLSLENKARIFGKDMAKLGLIVPNLFCELMQVKEAYLIADGIYSMLSTLYACQYIITSSRGKILGYDIYDN